MEIGKVVEIIKRIRETEPNSVVLDISEGMVGEYTWCFYHKLDKNNITKSDLEKRLGFGIKSENPEFSNRCIIVRLK